MSDGIRFAWAIAAAVASLGSYSSFAIGNSRIPDDVGLIEPVHVTAEPSLGRAAEPHNTIACTTDADCYVKNPHVLEDPDAELPTLMDDALGGLGYLPCVAEDGPAGDGSAITGPSDVVGQRPCYWNAVVRGDGTGDSFVVDSLGGVIYLFE